MVNIDDFNADQRYAWDVLNTGRNIYLYGEAGTGKSFLLSRYEQLHEGHVLICAPSGMAAQQLGGVTIHHAFGISTGPCPAAGDRHVQILEGTDVIVVDEISMCRRDLFECMVQLIRNAEKKKSKQIQLIVCGDFFQIPPVTTKKELAVLAARYGDHFGQGYCCFSDVWAQLEFAPVKLSIVMRQKDSVFSQYLGRIRTGDRSAVQEIINGSAPNPIEKAVTLCAKKSEADRINRDRLSRLPGDIETYAPKLDHTKGVYDRDFPGAETLTLKPGCRVMCTANVSGLTNGQLGTYTGYKDRVYGRVLCVLWDSGEVTKIEQYRWTVYDYKVVTDENGAQSVEKIEVAHAMQYPLRVSYAVTIHRSQGQTYEAVNLITDRTFVTGQLYTALSRCKSLDKLYINRGITVQKLADPTIKKFMKKIDWEAIELREHFGETKFEQVSAPHSDDKPKKKRGRKSKWHGEATMLVRIPVRLADEVVEYASRRLDEILGSEEDAE